MHHATHRARRRAAKAALAGALMAALTSTVDASCGSAFCTLMTDRYVQGAGEPHVGWNSDLRLEYVMQDRLRSGTRTIGSDAVTGEEAIERRTRNLNLIAALSYGFDADWSIGVRVPVVRRDHLHDLIDEDTGAPGPQERWRFTRVGDVQLIARRQLRAGDASTALAVHGGVKLPTGSVNLRNEDGARAERALQPGSGTTDLVLGAAARRALGALDAIVLQAGAQLALAAHEEFKPGVRFEAAGAWSHAFTPAVGSVIQLNARQRQKDSGPQSEPANSGSTIVDLSPGLTVGVGRGATLYAYVQVPVYQRVRGIQLVPRNAFAIGWTQDF